MSSNIPLKETVYYILDQIYVQKVYVHIRSLNNYHESIELTTELSLSKFLDIELINEEGKYITKVHRKESIISKNQSQSDIRKTSSGSILDTGRP